MSTDAEDDFALGAGSTPSGIAWRYSAMKPRIGPFDVMLVFPPLLIFLFRPRVWTAVLALVVIATLYAIEIFQHMPLRIAIRMFRSTLAGKVRPVVSWWKRVSL